MNKKRINLDVSSKRMLTTKEAEGYTGLGKLKLREWAESIGAVQKFGTRVLFDKYVIDKALDNRALDQATETA